MILRNLDEQENLSIRVSSAAPETLGARPSLFGGFFLQALKQRHETPAPPNGVWMIAAGSGYKQRLTSAGVDINPHSSDQRSCSGLLLVSLIALLVAIAGGLAVQRRVTLPLSALEEQVDRMGSVKTLSDLDESGPREIAALSHALNRMTRRIQQTEADKAIMLAGVSHDLRSPLTKLRLSLAMLDDADTELLGTETGRSDREHAGTISRIRTRVRRGTVASCFGR
ncbi:MAG: HAMP domain-containing protein [Nitratireductor sp.]